MRFAEIEGNKVRHVLPAELTKDYKVLPPNCIEIALDSDVEQGDFYENGEFRKPTEEEIVAQVPIEQVKFILPLTETQRDEILIALAFNHGIEP